MFVKRSTKIVKGIPYTYISLTEGYRQGRKVKHRTVANLGKLSSSNLDGLIRNLIRLRAKVATSPGPSSLKKAKPQTAAAAHRRVHSMPEKKRGTANFEFNLGFGNVFKGLGNLFDLVSEIVEKGESVASQVKEFRGEGKLKDIHGVYGFSIRTAAGGKATIEPFGNIKRTKEGPVVEDVTEPITDIFDEGDAVQVICELPGVDEDKIKVELQGDILQIYAEGKRRKYHKETLLSSKVKPGSMITAYKNGMLEIKLTKENVKKG